MPLPQPPVALATPEGALLRETGPGSTDADLVASTRAGDGAAQAMLYRRHAATVLAVATRLLGRHADAEDVAQDSFVVAFTSLSQLRDDKLFRAWLLRITVHNVHRRFRKRKLLRKLGLDRGEDDATLAQQALPGVGAEDRAELRKLDAVLNDMPTNERSAWVLRHVEGFEPKEAADALDVSLATIKRWIASADARVSAHVQLGAAHALEKPGDATEVSDV